MSEQARTVTPRIPWNERLEPDPRIAGGVFGMALLIKQRAPEVADVVPDNGAPYGDAWLSPEGGGSVCPVPPVTCALIARQVVVEAARRIEVAGEVAPAYLPGHNVPGRDEHNHTLESRYAGRIRQTA